MPAVFHKHGVRFEFPAGWSVTEDATPTEVCITVSGETASFWSLTLFFDRPSPEEVAETVVRAFCDEYDEVDVYPSTVDVGSQPAVGADLEFMALDLTNSAYVRVCRTNRFTAVVLYQGTDHELAEGLPELEAISSTIEFEQDDEWPDFEAREAEDVAGADHDEDHDHDGRSHSHDDGEDEDDSDESEGWNGRGGIAEWNGDDDDSEDR